MISVAEPILLVVGLVVAAVGAGLARGRAARATRGALLSCLAVALSGPRLDAEGSGSTALHLFAVDPRRGPEDRAALAAALETARAPKADEQVILIAVDETPRRLPADPALGALPKVEGRGDAARWQEALDIAAQAVPPDGELTVTVWGDLAGLRAEDAQRFTRTGAKLTARPSPALEAPRLQGLRLPDGPEAVAGGALRLAWTASGPIQLRASLRDSAGRIHELGAVPEGAVPEGAVPEGAVPEGAVAEGEAPELALPAAAEAGPATLIIEEMDRKAPIRHERALILTRPPRAWVATADRGEAASLRGLLEAEGAEVRGLGLAELRDLPGLAAADRPDLLVLAGVGAHRLSADSQAQIDAWVREGGHLVVTGGAEGWELGGWEDAPLRAILPLEADPSGATLDPAVTLLVVLDKSGSMARPAVLGAGSVNEGLTARMRGGRPEGSRIRLAAEGVVESVKRLRDNTDYIAVLGVDTQPMWLLRPTLVTDRAAISQAARNLTSGGGGIYITTAMEAAAPVILAATTPLKHVVLFADASDVGEQRRAKGGEEAVSFVSSLRRAGVTFSVVGIGGAGDRDLLYLQNLARVGGGQAWLAEDPRRLPALFARETERLLGAPPPAALRLRAEADRWSPALDRVSLPSAPMLTGHHRLRARPGAVVSVRTSQGPLLAGATVGLGQTWALATDVGARSAQPWLGWSGWGTLWANLLRASTREQDQTDDVEAILTIRPDPDHPGRSRIHLSERDRLGRSRAPFNRTISVRRADGADETTADVHPLSVVAPGAWETSALLPANAALELRPSEPEGAKGAAFLRVTEAEDPGLGPDPAVLSAWTADVSARPAPVRRSPLWWAFAAAAALLLPVDAWARRIGLRTAGRR